MVPAATTRPSRPSGPATFDLLAEDTTGVTWARRGRLSTPHGTVETPAFMPVGTQATVKTLHPDEVAGTGAEIVLANTYHLMLRPGPELIAAAGGLHRFMGWDRPVLTDSGGFQIFSLAGQTKVTENGATFRSHVDGSLHTVSPERSVALQLAFGADVIMAFDHLIGLPAPRAPIADATARTARWLERCIATHRELGGPARGVALFGISQGGMEEDLRRQSAMVLAEAEVDGCAVGGLSVGEPKPVMAAMLEATTPHLPPGKPRYLMGVGSPEDLWEGVARGIDLFDCVLPTRLARNGALFTPTGRANLRAVAWRDVHAPIDPTCDCATCARFTAAYVHHLLRTEEVLGLRLASVHNLRFLARQMATMRRAIERGTFQSERRRFHDAYRPVGAPAV